LNRIPIAHVDVGVDVLHLPVILKPGPNKLRIHIEGEVGATIAILVLAKQPPLPPVRVGSLELPYGSIEPPMVLEFCLKNSSPDYPRAVRLACISPDGVFSEITPIYEIAPNGTAKIRIPDVGLEPPPTSDFATDPNPWIEGSVNVIWVGRSLAPITGYVISGMETLDSPHLVNRVTLPLIPHKPPINDKPAPGPGPGPE
jgi:hypothetical protein